MNQIDLLMCPCKFLNIIVHKNYIPKKMPIVSESQFQYTPNYNQFGI